MKICHACKNYIPEEVQPHCPCSKVEINHTEYGPFRKGASCIHDPYLKDYFEPLGDISDQLKKGAAMYKRSEETISELRSKVSRMEEMFERLKNGE